MHASTADAAADAEVNVTVGGSPETGGNEVPDATGPTSAALSVDRSIVDLGTLDLRGTNAAVVAVTNTGEAASGMVIVVVSAGVTATGCTGVLAGGASCIITISVTPAAAGAFSGTVAISANPGALTPLRVSVIARVSTGPTFLVSPAAFDLGTIAVGAVAPKQVITVTAGMDLTDLTVTASGADLSLDRVASTCTTRLVAHASCAVVVDFVAAAAGVRSDAVVISSGGASGMTVRVPITAVALMPAKLVINPSTAAFAASVGQTSSAITFGVINLGDVATGVLDTTITGPNAAEFTATSTCLTLTSLATCTITVTWTPSAVGTMSESATLVVTDTAVGGTSTTATLRGGGTGGPNVLTITPASGDMGSALIGSLGAATTFTVSNTGSHEWGNLTVTLSNADDFKIIDDHCTGTSLVAKTGTCTIAISFKPATCGTKSTTLMVTEASGNLSAKTLTGFGFSPSALSVTPAAVDFGSVGVNRTSPAQTITARILGCGGPTGPLSLTESGSFAEFSMTSNTCTGTLGQGESCSFVLTFAPTTTGTKAAIFTLTDGAVAATVAVSGTAL
jgi:hypothetical protein